MTDPTELEGIAIVGMACRFPGASNVEEFWQNLIAGVESIRHFSRDELIERGVSRERIANPRFVPAGSLVDDHDRFDAAFFGFTPREAQILDPQHRLFFECAWEALEDAGYDPDRYPAPIGLFAGSSLNTYLLHNLIPNHEIIAAVGLAQTCIANDKDFLTTHVSYKFNLRGPSVAVQTACSTSLVAVQFAYQNLLTYQCDMALAGGVCLQVPHEPGYVHQDGGIASTDGHCRAFDASASGTMSGNGVGVVVLKRLSDAMAARDRIVAVIRGAAINNDGAVKIGFTAPSVDGQAEVIALAQAQAAIGAETIGFIEAHGTGTPLGDPVEVGALTKVFRASTPRVGFCALGSVKTNIGHLDAAAGVAGLIKAALVVQRGLIPPSLHFHEANPQLELDTSPFFVNAALREWPAGDLPRRAGVSSFGIGGTNVHVILEEAPRASVSDAMSRPAILLLSARTDQALDTSRLRLAGHLRDHADLDPADVAYTLQVGRRMWSRRYAVVASSVQEAARSLSAGEGHRGTTDDRGRSRSVVFLFPGQGAQYAGMGAGLYASEPVFREHIDRSAQILRRTLGFDLAALLSGDASIDADTRLIQTGVAQPALFAVEYALAKMWMEWGVVPEAMIGHSLGEYVAACVAGVFSLEDALQLVTARGRMMQALAPGAMLALPLAERDVRPWLDGACAIAAINGPRSCVVSGALDSVEELEQRLRAAGIEGLRLRTSHAFHSAMMDPILERFRAEVDRVRLVPPEIPYVSNLTGTWIGPDQATDPDYWVRHLRETVRFDEGLRTLLQDGDGVPLEVGPGQTLTRCCRQIAGIDRHGVPCTSMRQPLDSRGDMTVIAEALASLWTSGVVIDWERVHTGEARGRVALPTYPFERARHWIDPPAALDPPSRTRPSIDDWLYVPRWSALPAGGAPPAAEVGTVVVLADDEPLAGGLARALEARGYDVVVVRQGDRFARHAGNRFELAPCREDYARLFEALERERRVPRLIYHCLSLIATGAEDPFPAAPEAEQERGFFSLLWLAQAFGRLPTIEPVRVVAVTNNLLKVRDGDVLAAPGRASLLGPCLVVPQEYPHVSCRLVDLETLDDDATDTWVDMLIAEGFDVDGPTIVAYRDHRRWQRSFEKKRWPAGQGRASRLRENGVYWITGGLGGVGFALAGFLGREYGARVALSSRIALPPRSEWNRGVQAGVHDDRQVARIQQIVRLEAEGIEVFPVQADATRLDEMEAAAAAIEQRFGRIDGIVHAAGVPGGGLVPLKTREAAMRVLASKILAPRVLARIARGHDVGFVVLCSSIAALQGGFGQVDYAGANAVLDAFAPYHTMMSGIPTFSIDWDAWLEGGMAVEAERRLRERLDGLPIRADASESSVQPGAARTGLDDRDGVEAFRRIVNGAEAQVAVSTVELNARIRQQRHMLATITSLGGATGDSSTGIDPAEIGGAPDLERQIARLWERALGIEQIGLHDNFFELGGDSLAGVQLIAQMNSELQLQITVPRFFEAPTIAGLATLARSPAATGDSLLEQSHERGSLRRASRRHTRGGQRV